MRFIVLLAFEGLLNTFKVPPFLAACDLAVVDLAVVDLNVDGILL